MSGGDKIRAEQYNQRLAQTRRFEDGDCMSAAYRHEGKMHWATYYQGEPCRTLAELEGRWRDTNIALQGVKLMIIRRQDEIDKKLYAQDFVLEALRNRARAIGHARIELNMMRLKIRYEDSFDLFLDKLGLNEKLNVSETLRN